MGVRGEPAAHRTATSGIVCGLVTAGAIGAVLGLLGEYQVHDFADTDATYGIAGGLVASVGAVAVLAAACGIARWRRAPWPAPHVVVPLVLVPAAVLPLVTGAERNRLEAGLIWGAAAVAVHVLLAYAMAGGRWRRRTAVALVLPCAVAGLLTFACQHRWRTQKFEAVGLPLYVPQAPGYRLTGSWAGRYSVSMALAGPSGARLYARIEGPDSHGLVCTAPIDRPRLSTEVWFDTESALFCLPGGAVLALVPGGDSGSVAGLLPSVTLRAVDAAVLADHPDNSAMAEPD
ncbi:hypothetical protein [Jidongwangia harbinensis]|uniref:hypothetical protein n=1 Tax=Jidongwangia harbinensis TaxID=2878561 RepID=UPI001CDA38CB|nr:hypothetical protein [Jidongwangia harbinensis]MCA2216004.1 hypothetical protein [Jidongwangia harbinensis]